MESALTVTQLNSLAKGVLKSSPSLSEVWVAGEISGLKVYPSGHCYFTLKDETSQLSCAIFAGKRARLDFVPADSMKVLVFGSADIYLARGTYQFIVETMKKSGIGELYQRFEEMKSRLKEEGLFDESHKKAIPPYPSAIGVVTSETGAVIHDIITTSADRFPADILLAPATVQGDGAADSIVKGIRLLERCGVDVIIVGRGGGSIEDLWPFNEEKVARAIYGCEIPIVSAVGHETDFTIADFVADLRAPTPTGAAALILREKSEIENDLRRNSERMDRALDAVAEKMRSAFEILESKLSPDTAERNIAMHAMELDRLSESIVGTVNGTVSAQFFRLHLAVSKLSPDTAEGKIEGMSSKIDFLYSVLSPGKAANLLRTKQTELNYVMKNVFELGGTMLYIAEARLSTVVSKLEALNPLKVMERGYGIVKGPRGVVTSVSLLSPGDPVEIRLRDGIASGNVNEIRSEKE